VKILFLATTTGYQTRMFGEAAARLGVTLLFATDRCDRLDDPWWDSAIPIRFHQDDASVRAILRATAHDPPAGILAVGDRATVIAALTARALGLPGHSPDAAAAARDKHLTRERLRAARLPVPAFVTTTRHADAARLAPTLPYPVVVKPVVLSGSRGVIRADTPADFVAAHARVSALLQAADVRAMHDPAADVIQVERFIAGREYALEGLLHHGRLHTLAIFDKPDPLDGPFFEETLYITPSRADDRTQAAIEQAVTAAIAAIGLHHGPVHAECRVNEKGVFVLEVAARPIGGLCAKALRFEHGSGARISLEELLLRHALGEAPDGWIRERAASGVMMIPIPRAGVYRRTDNLEQAGQVSGVTGIEITAKPDQQLLPLPEGASYLGFIFAEGDTPQQVEEALRAAHARLSFTVDRPVPIL
jgi:hypothetical protein